MFATIDGENTRTVRGFVTGADDDREVPVPAALQREAFEVAVLPTAERVEALAERWSDTLDLADDEGFAVEVRRITFDGGDLTAGTERIVLVGFAP